MPRSIVYVNNDSAVEFALTDSLSPSCADDPAVSCNSTSDENSFLSTKLLQASKTKNYTSIFEGPIKFFRDGGFQGRRL